MLRAAFCVACVAFAALPLASQQLQRVSIGNLKLKNGETINNCTLGYRTFGKLNDDKSNAVLFPTWFSGTTKDLADLVGPNKLIDSNRFYVIAVDALGDGVTTSPSNSADQPHMKFPKFGIRDMVEAEHTLLTQKLSIGHLLAVIGISMGGMQTFQWMVSYPDFMDYAVPIVGSPRLTSYDLLLWTTEEHAIENDPSWDHGEYSETPDSMKTVAGIHALALDSPDYWLEHTPRERFDDAMKTLETRNAASFDANNWVRQLQAMMSLDVSREFGGDMQKAAAAVKAKALIVPSLQDHMVNPHPALDFGKLIHARMLVLDDNCGHLAPGCNTKRIGDAINELLVQQ
jgi:homoserine O-acetyltransferase